MTELIFWAKTGEPAMAPLKKAAGMQPFLMLIYDFQDHGFF